ncbi:MAG: PAS domain S-box protein [Verrucomicrobiota bacterium]
MNTPHRTAESPVRWSLLLTVFLLVSAGLLATVHAYYKHQAGQIRQAAITNLSSVAGLKVGELSQWRRERLGDARFYQRNAEFARLVQSTVNRTDGVAPAGELEAWIRETQSSHHYSIALLDADGVVRHATDPGKLPPRPLLDETMARTDVHLLDFYRPVDQGAPRLAVVVPFLAPGSADRVVATMLWVLDPEDYLYPLLTRWPFRSATASSMLIRRDADQAVFLSPADGDHPSAMPLTRTDLAAVQAVLGTPAPIVGKNLAGREITAVASPVKDTPWTLLVGMERQEIEQSLHRRLRELLVTSLALLAAAGAAIAFLWRGQNAQFLRERLRHAETLRETEKRFRLLFHGVPDAVMLAEAPGPGGNPGRFVEVNDVACQRLGYTRDEFSRLTPLDIDSPAAREQVPRHVARLLADGAATWEGEHVAKDGRVIPVEINARAFELENRSLWLAISRDISERRDARQQLARLNRALAVSNGINQTIVRERDRRTLLARACQIAVDRGGFRMVWIGLLSADGTRIEPAVHAGELGDYLAGINISLATPMEKAGPASVSVRTRAPSVRNDIRRHTGLPWADRALRLGYRSCASFPLIISGEPRGMVALYADETGFFADDEVDLLNDMARNLALALELAEQETLRRQAEEALKTSEQRFRTILENMPGIAVQAYDREHRVIFWNQSSAELYGWTATEALGRRPEELFVPPDMVAELNATVDAWLAGGPPLPPGEFTLRRKDGSEINVFSGFFLFKNEHGDPEVFSLDIDLTARNAAQAELHLLHAALEATPSAWVITNAEGIIQWVNPAFTALTGYPSEEALGRTPPPALLRPSGRLLLSKPLDHHPRGSHLERRAAKPPPRRQSLPRAHDRRPGARFPRHHHPLRGDEAGHHRAKETRTPAPARPAHGRHRPARRRHRPRPQQRARAHPAQRRAAADAFPRTREQIQPRRHRDLRAARRRRRAPGPHLRPRHRRRTRAAPAQGPPARDHLHRRGNLSPRHLRRAQTRGKPPRRARRSDPAAPDPAQPRRQRPRRHARRRHPHPRGPRGEGRQTQGP